MSSIDRSYNEKRDFIRMRINSAVQVRHNGQEFEGVCKDLSGAGMLIQTEQLLDVGSELEVSIKQDGESQLPFKANAVVSRTESNTDGSYVLGLSINEILD